MTSGSNCVRTVPAGNSAALQSAINAAKCGDTIVLAAGSTYSGNFTIPATSCSGWIEIVSSALASLPASGNRVGPANVAKMPTISTPNVSPAIQFLSGSNHWRLIGLEITTSYVSTGNAVYGLVTAGMQSDGATAVNALAQLSAFLIFDRIYIHGLSTTNTKRGIQMDTQSIGIVDSYCDEIHYNGNDSQCFASWNGAGPYLIQNNFIQAGAEDILFGGADPAIANLVPSDIVIVGNTIQKNPAWRSAAAPSNWVIKNLVELKNAQRVLLDGNVIQYVWAAGQVGFAVLLTPRNQDGTCPWCVVQDVTITHNLIQHVSGGTEIAGSDNNNPSLPSARVLVRNNLYNDISAANWGGRGWAFEILTGSNLSVPHDITIDHNTSFLDQTFLTLGDSGAANNVQLTNNLSDYGVYGIFGSGMGSGVSSLNAYLSNLSYKAIVLMGSQSNAYPLGTSWSSLSTVGFTNYSGKDPNLSGNFQLLSSSAYHNAGSDGKDIGVWDWSCLNSDSTAALAGTFVPGSGGCAVTASLSGQDLPPQAPTSLNAVVQ